MDFVADNQAGLEETPSAKILVVDDDALSQRMMQLLLKRDGHQVDIVSSGLEAIEAVKLQEYDVVFMDLQMPGMDGIEASRRIRDWESEGRHTFIVALTASYLPEKGQELFDAGIDNYISKPFEIEHIQRLLKYSIRRSPDSAGQSTEVVPGLPAQSILDVRKGVEQVGGDLQIYRDLLREFIEELPGRLQLIEQAFGARDMTAVARAAHNLSGVAANLGALQLSNYARQLEGKSVQGYTEALDLLFGEIRRIGATLIDSSNGFLSNVNFHIRSW